jgi:tRNA threonylcarbamoyladenosine biosynthesis protein TsaE
MTTWSFISTHVKASIAFGIQLGAAAVSGQLMALQGALGAGKTTLTKGIAVGAGVADMALVKSPTFVLVKTYQGRVAIHHVDLYRLETLDTETLMEISQHIGAGGLCIIEWADKFPELLPQDYLQISIAHVDEHSRRFTCTAYGTTSAELLQQLKTCHA